MTRIIPTLFLLALPALAAAQSEGPDPEPLVTEALAASPSLLSMRHREAALHERASVAGAWPDPMLAIEYSNAPVTSFGLSDHPMAGLQLKVTQTLRPPGWSVASRGVLDHKAEASAQAVAESELGLARMVRQAWWMLVRARLLRGVTDEHLARTDELLAAARIRYETGAIGQHAVLRLEVLRDRLQDELGEFDRLDAELSAALVEALADDGGRTFETPASVTPVAPPSDTDWLALAEAHRPLLAKLSAEQSAAEEAARAARLEALPDPSVWAGYRIRTVQTEMDPGTDLVSLGVGLPIPTGSGRRASGARAAALEEASAASSMRESALDGVTADMAAVLARWTRAWDKAGTYDNTLIPGARATLETTRSDFAVGRADFASLFEAEVALLDLERARIVAAVDTHIQQAEATAVLGTLPPGGTP
ncbi:MAG: TolC family protein [Alphaproteobacteria bacterium]|nr:TolC family protein [Alphaproteobacteria bacterium]MCB9695691.1 TolC family protein [Alphaproteobacteria bacterium]